MIGTSGIARLEPARRCAPPASRTSARTRARAGPRPSCRTAARRRRRPRSAPPDARTPPHSRRSISRAKASGCAQRERPRGMEVGARTSFDHVGRERPGRPGKADQRGLGGQALPHLPDGGIDGREMFPIERWAADASIAAASRTGSSFGPAPSSNRTRQPSASGTTRMSENRIARIQAVSFDGLQGELPSRARAYSRTGESQPPGGVALDIRAGSARPGASTRSAAARLALSAAHPRATSAEAPAGPRRDFFISSLIIS